MKEYTERQKRILEEIPERQRSYQMLVYDSALELYDLIRDEPEERLVLVIHELTNLANNSVCQNDLGKPMTKYDATSRRVYQRLERQGHSGNTYFSTILELSKVVGDCRKVYTAPWGLESSTVSVDSLF